MPPQQLDRKLYLDVAKSLNLIGGKWKGGKIMAFIFPEDPTELLTQVAGGEKKNLKKEFQFFSTPDLLADKLVEMAETESHHSILEPSAGQGAIINAIIRKHPRSRVQCCETMDVNRTFLEKIQNCSLIGYDFLNCDLKNIDRIIANPPFTKNQDIDHIQKMYELLKPGGILVSIASCHWQFCNNKKESAFRGWLFKVSAEIEEVEAGAFKKSGTMINSVIIKIIKD